MSAFTVWGLFRFEGSGGLNLSYKRAKPRRIGFGVPPRFCSSGCILL